MDSKDDIMNLLLEVIQASFRSREYELAEDVATIAGAYDSRSTQKAVYDSYIELAQNFDKVRRSMDEPTQKVTIYS